MPTRVHAKLVWWWQWWQAVTGGQVGGPAAWMWHFTKLWTDICRCRNHRFNRWRVPRHSRTCFMIFDPHLGALGYFYAHLIRYGLSVTDSLSEIFVTSPLSRSWCHTSVPAFSIEAAAWAPKPKIGTYQQLAVLPGLWWGESPPSTTSPL